ncbi:transglutaminase domain-containing protein [Pyrococcus abyssi]|uniref:Transglutaminase-like domain-containing protein n=1 Tax=Pyrococcus abyssi (strain GE5 / Orsay) TaxID=272844 RepID=Q9UY74_PYRAB|nr:transglutaminase domain-containing protein [Pyrococcus abyssi]CAB50538.1 Hypothetical protein, containing transglutaminase-like core domain [Pyrococcus abyssi GE5]CCE71095.1 TPA: hypothetical protein PAB1274 [Pyrococcus abyssi GE5]
MMRKVIALALLVALGVSLALSPTEPILSFNVQRPRNEVDVSRNIYYSLLLNNTPVMKVTQEKGVVEYLRQNVYVVYENGVWKSIDVKGSNEVIVERPRIPYRAMEDNVKVELLYPLLSGNLYTALHTSRVSVPSEYYPEFELFKPIKYPVKSYSFTVISYNFSQDELRRLKTRPLRMYLQVPNLSKRVYELAFNITKNAKTPYEKAIAIRDYLISNYIYDVHQIPPIPGIDPVEWFLFYSKRGVCLDFNTAFVILARIVGIPARLVTGYRIKPISGEQVVKANQAHAWAEIYLDGAGWITIDATGYERPPQRMEQKRENIDVKVEPLPNGTVKLSFSKRYTGDVKVLFNGQSVTLHVNGTSALVPINVTNPGWMRIELKNKLVEVLIKNLPKIVVTPSNLTIAKGETGKFKVITSGDIRINSPLPFRVEKAPYGYDVYVEGTRVGKYTVKVTSGNVSKDVEITVKVKTRVEIRNYPPSIKVGEDFYVEGIVVGEYEYGKPSGKVTIEARVEKDKKGIVIGEGQVKDGRFRVKCRIDKLGEYELVAIYHGNSIFLPSTSDPRIRVISGSKLTVEKFQVAPVGNINVRGVLTLENGDPVKGEKILVYLDGRLISVLMTNEGGIFSGYIKVTGPGVHSISVVYPGNEFLKGSKVEWSFVAIKVELDYSKTITAGEDLKVSGRVYGISDGVITVKGWFGEKRVDMSNSKVEFYLPIPEDLSGIVRFDVLYNGTKVGEFYLFVKPKVEIQVKGTIMIVNKTSSLEVRVLRGGDPVSNAKVFLTTPQGETLSNLTDDNGIAIFTLRPEAPGRFRYHILVILGDFFLEDNIDILVLSHELYYYVVLASLGFLSLFAGAILLKLFMSVKISFDRAPPVYTPQESIIVTLNRRGKLLVDGKPIGSGKKFRLKLSPGEHLFVAKKFIFKDKAKVLVVNTPEEAVVKMFVEKFNGEKNKTAREILGYNVITWVFEKARYGISGISIEEFKLFLGKLREVVGSEIRAKK